MLHVDLDELIGLQGCLQIFVRYLFRAILPHQALRLEDLADRPFVEQDAFLRELPVELQGATFLFLAQGNDRFLHPDRCFFG